MFTLPRVALLLTLLVSSASHASTISFDLVWSATTGNGITGSGLIEAQPGDQLTLDVWVTTTGPEGLCCVGVSVEYDLGLTDELDVVSAANDVLSQALVGLDYQGTDPIVDEFLGDPIDSTTTRSGRVIAINGATLGDGPVDETFRLGQVVFEVNPGIQVSVVDIQSYFEPGADGAFDNLGDPIASPSFGVATIELLPVPEPSSLALLAASLGALAVFARRSV